MNISKEQLVDVKKANIEAVLKLGLLSLEHAERLVDLNLRNAKSEIAHRKARTSSAHVHRTGAGAGRPYLLASNLPR